MRTKRLGAGPMLRNVMGLSEGDRAYCGPYGAITCTLAAKNSADGRRRFRVDGSLRLANGGGWTSRELREAVLGKRKA